MFHVFSNLPPVNILLVEDDEIDIEAIVRGFKKYNIGNSLTVARDGIEALNKIEEGIPSPLFILLDLNMPKMNGIEFLEVLRQNEAHKNSIVFVLTTSDDDRDLWAAYEYHIAGYLLKSQAARDFSNVAEIIDVYRRYVLFPPPNASYAKRFLSS